jgi:putative restriction endonuclease
MSVYICLGAPNRGHPEDLEECSVTGDFVYWTINSKAEIDDEVFFYLIAPVSSFVARGIVQSTPEQVNDPRDEWFGHFMADIGDLTMLPRWLHIRRLRSAFPAWGWLKQPRRSTRIPDKVVPQLLQMAGTPNARDGQVSDVLADLESIYADSRLGPTEREALCAARIGQGPFRQDLESMWKGCAVTGCRELPLLRASHIKPWRASTDVERLDPYNGLLLVPNLDVAFDKGYISFLDEGSIVISSRLDQTTRRIMGIHRNLRLRRVAKKNRLYLDYHRRVVLQP